MRVIQIDEDHSFYMRCWDCYMWGTPVPENTDTCGNCGGHNVSIYYPSLKENENTDIVRQSVALIKSRFTRWGGSVVLPADSVIEDCVKEILSLSGYNAPVVKSN